jgi:hypothetical protein
LEREVEGEAAREEAREEATMALARESTRATEGDTKERFGVGPVREEGRRSDAETKESSEEARVSSDFVVDWDRVLEGMGIGLVAGMEELCVSGGALAGLVDAGLVAVEVFLAGGGLGGSTGLVAVIGGICEVGRGFGSVALGSAGRATGSIGFGDFISGFCFRGLISGDGTRPFIVKGGVEDSEDGDGFRVAEVADAPTYGISSTFFGLLAGLGGPLTSKGGF